jgi:phosphatidylglycerophosphate synthase
MLPCPRTHIGSRYTCLQAEACKASISNLLPCKRCACRFVCDELDGRAARTFNQTSTLGAVLDMVTDRWGAAAHRQSAAAAAAAWQQQQQR